MLRGKIKLRIAVINISMLFSSFHPQTLILRILFPMYFKKNNDNNNTNIFLCVDNNVNNILTVWPWERPEQKSHWISKWYRLCYWTYEVGGSQLKIGNAYWLKTQKIQPTPDSDWPAALAGGYMSDLKFEIRLVWSGFIVACVSAD